MGECAQPVQLHVGKSWVPHLDLADLVLPNACGGGQLSLRHVRLLVLPEPFDALMQLLEARRLYALPKPELLCHCLALR